MTRKMIIPLLFGLIGTAILVSLGTWQVKRLAWKQDILAVIAADIQAAPVALPAAPDPAMHRYLPVQATGETGAAELFVLVSRKQIGAGYRVITPFQTGDRIIMLDRGFIPTTQKTAPRPPETIAVTGNLHWPQDRTSSTPDNDVAANIWFARDVAQMAQVLGTDPVLIIARSDTGQGVEPLPVGIEGIPNDHLHYAITWFLLAIVWAGMTVFLLWRIRQRTV